MEASRAAEFGASGFLFKKPVGQRFKVLLPAKSQDQKAKSDASNLF